MRAVAGISVTPVKGFALLHPEEIMLIERGVSRTVASSWSMQRARGCAPR
jgi:hypothetical protein